MPVGQPQDLIGGWADTSDTPIGPGSDLFSLGLIAFRLLVGRDYWGVGNTKQILAGLLSEPLALASKRGSAFGDAFDTWFAKACARELRIASTPRESRRRHSQRRSARPRRSTHR